MIRPAPGAYVRVSVTMFGAGFADLSRATRPPRIGPMASSRARLVAVALAAGFLAACTGEGESVFDRDDGEPTTTSTTTPAEPGTLDWRDCDGGECAGLAVPLDYDDPDGETIDVALIRVPATDPDQRIGSLLVNPGGPGASGVDFVRNSAFFLPDELREHFDIVGFDARGTGETVPVRCEPSLDEVIGYDYSPDSPDERSRLEAGLERLVDDCQERNGDMLANVSSQDTVRDMDRIRDAVGDEKLTYVGFSYGTYLGALYADFFPDKVRALALDGAVDPELDARGTNLEQAAGFERSLNAFLDDCAGNPSCAFYRGGNSHAAFDELAAEIDADPLAADDDRQLGPGELILGVAQPLYGGRYTWPELSEGLDAAADGDPEPMLALADDYSGRHEDGSYESLLEPFWAIGCTDLPSIGGVEGYPDLEDEFQAAAPRFGVSFLYQAMVCSLWPADAAPDPRPLDAPGAPPILVVGTLGDPATPYQWAESLADVLESGVLLTAAGEQHTAYLSNSCATDLVDRYLIDLELPAPGTRCEE
jgi:pimeloyl-ACP methyl ester carboxylesterase